jgi:glycosyltransferase involved in cell wall biosynthesis
MTEKRKNILIVLFSFAPNGKVGSRRFGFLSKIFEEQYFNCYILAPKEKYYLYKDNSVPFGGTVYRTGMYPPFTLPVSKYTFFERACHRIWSSYFSLKDPYTGWILPSLLQGLKIIRKHKIEVIIVSVPPITPIISALLLSRLTKTRLIIDYRDPWTTNPLFFKETFVKKKLSRFVEKLVVKQASDMVFCSEIMRDEFLEHFSRYTKARSHVITNGLTINNNVSPLYLDKTKKVMLYAGNFYGERKLQLLLGPLSQLQRKGIINNNNFCLYLFSVLSEGDRKNIKEYGLNEIIREHPLVEYQKIIKYMKGSDILFLPSGSDVKYAIPFKFFDYLSVKRPIFAIASRNCAVADLMGQVDCGKLAYIDDQNSIQESLQEMVSENRTYSFSGFEQFGWHAIAKKYADVINGLT